MAVRYIFLVSSLAYILDRVCGHGMLWDPPNRSSMWRFGYKTPKNYIDNQNFCGGYKVQYNINGGKCGICGDDYRKPRPRANENHGKLGLGIITRKYYEGFNVGVIVKITASHLGKFIFSLCNLDREKETEECFKRNPLRLANGSDSFQVTEYKNKNYWIYLKLPQGLTCKHCVLRWHYVAGNNWGLCPDGKSRLGCGPQETFRSCSDISIVPYNGKRVLTKNGGKNVENKINEVRGNNNFLKHRNEIFKIK